MYIFISILIISFVLLLFFVKSQDFHQIADKQLSKKFVKNGLTSCEYQLDEHTKMHYWIGGTGKPLLLVHGFGAAAKFQWDRQIKAFLKDYQLIIPDLIYFGESASNSGNFSIDFQAESIQKLLEHLQLDQLNIVSISYGGLVAITLADLIPHKIKKLAICGSPIRYFTEDDIQSTLNTHQVERFEDLLVPAEKEGLKRLIGLAYHKPPFIPSFILKDVHNGMNKVNVDEKKNLLTYLYNNRTELSARDFDLSCKILLLWGEHDSLIPKKIGEQLQKDFGNEQARFVTIQNTAHAPNVERASIYNKTILDFLAS